MAQIPTDQLQSALLPAIQWYSNLYAQNSMEGDLQRGQNSDRKTATQNLIEDRNQTANMGWTMMMMLKFQLEIGALTVDAMRNLDRHPRLLDVMGSNLPINLKIAIDPPNSNTPTRLERWSLPPWATHTAKNATRTRRSM